MKNQETEEAIFNQICKVNDLDPQVIREEAEVRNSQQGTESNEYYTLIMAAFHHRANTLVANLNIDQESNDSSMEDGKEYKADGDPAAPSFMINEEYIRKTYRPEMAEKIIEALGQVQLPIQA